MEVTITHSGVANSVNVSASVPNIVSVVPNVPINVEVQLIRDGKNGKSAYDIAVENGYLGTEQQYEALVISGLNVVVNHVKNETPLGLINGANATYTTSFNFIPESVEVFVNGLIQQKVTEFQTIGNNTITLGIAPLVGENLVINYIKI